MKARYWVSVFVLILLTSLSGCQALRRALRSPTAQPAPAIQLSPTARHVVRATPSATLENPSPPTPLPTRTPVQTLGEQGLAMKPKAREDLTVLRSLTRYTIEVAIDYDNLAFEGRQVVDYTNTEATPLDRLNFRLFPNGGRSYGNGSLAVSRVMVNGAEVEPALSLEDTVLEVRLPAILKPGESAQLGLEFEGTVPRDFGKPSDRQGYGIYNFADNVMALAGWYPILAVFDDEGWNLDPPSGVGDSVYSDAAFYTVDVTTRSDLVVAATGTQISQQNLNGSARYRFVSGPVREFFMALSPAFEKTSELVDEVTVNSYYLPEHQAGGEAALQIAADSLKAYDRRFGAYPYGELDVVDAPMEYAAGVEFPGIILVGSFMYDDPDQPFFEIATAHEVAHQWWYNVVGNDVIDEPWLDEALVTYSSGVYIQDIKGPAAYQRILEQWQQIYQRAVEQGQDHLITQPLEYWEQPEKQGSYGAIVYRKGALFFAAVRETIGDDAFFKALQAYYTTHKYGIATPDDLLNAFGKAAGRQLDDLYQEWLYSARSWRHAGRRGGFASAWADGGGLYSGLTWQR